MSDFDKFYRNEQGRLLLNIERAKGLPITSPEDLEALYPNDFKAQTEYLKQRIEELGGAVLRASEFELEDSPIWLGYTLGQTWNGWAMPMFDKDICDEIIAWLYENEGDEYNVITYDPETEVYTWIDKNYEDEEPCIIDKNEFGMYSLFSGYFCWMEVEGDSFDD